jgi:hypothetical protein
MNYTKQDQNLIKPDNYDSATFQTEITSVRTATVNGTANVINKIEYQIWAEIDGQRTSFSSEVVYSDEFLNEQGSFAPYESLTKEQVIAWVEDHTHLQSVHYSLCNRFIQPVESTPALPWA